MKLIVGLGNPDDKYIGTRHNVGFMCVDQFVKNQRLGKGKNKYLGEYYSGKINEEIYHVIKPYTYMNLSGTSVERVVSFYKIPIEDIIVVYDDVDLPVGKVRVREKGTDAGHKGIRSIIQILGTTNIKRIRVGIGKSDDMINFVLSQFNKEETIVMEEAIKDVANALEEFVTEPFEKVMSNHNTVKK